MLFLFACFSFTEAMGQATILIRHADRDTAYIKEFYRKHLVVRAYESTKFNNFKFIDGSKKLIYKPNDHNIFGLGLNYRFISLNIGLYVPAAGKNISIYGRTKDLDLQTHIYVHKFIVDLYAQFYHGYYLSNTTSSLSSYPVDRIEKRPDISTKDLSIVVQYLFNDKKFSYNAPFYQNELQKKSAGSFIVGGGLYHTNISGDSTLTPRNISYSNFFNSFIFNKAINNSIGFNGGYAYTVVIRKLFFITAMVSGGAGVNFATLSDVGPDQKNEKTGLGLNLTAKFAAGYNSDKYFAGINYIRLITEDNSTEPDTWQEVNIGNFRITIAKRFHLRKAVIPKSDLIEIE